MLLCIDMCERIRGLHHALLNQSIDLGARVGATRRSNDVSRTMAVLMAALVGLAGTAQGQVGLASHEARVAIIASIPSAAAVHAVGSPRVTRVRGLIREAAVSVRLSSNNGYRLIVRGTGRQEKGRSAVGRIWVKAVDGTFHELGEGSAVTVAQEQRQAGAFDRQVVYRIESSEVAAELTGLPICYDIAVNPVM